MFISLYKRHVYYRFRLSVMKLTVLFVISLCLIGKLKLSYIKAFEHTTLAINSRKAKDRQFKRTKANRGTDKQWITKYYTENTKMSNTNSTKKTGMNSGPWKKYQFLLCQIHPSCNSYSKRNIPRPLVFIVFFISENNSYSSIYNLLLIKLCFLNYRM